MLIFREAEKGGGRYLNQLQWQGDSTHCIFNQGVPLEISLNILMIAIV